MTTLPLTEKEFMATVTDLARAYGYHVYHPYLSIRSERGWPDLAMVRGGDRPRFVLAELKSEKGKLTPSQERWLGLLAEAGVECHAWWPRDWETIVEVLT